MSFAKGCRPDPPHRRTQISSRALVGDPTKATLPASFSAEHLEGPILDQNSCGSCTGHGSAQGLWVACQVQGCALPLFPSPDGIYKNTRCIERAAAYPADYAGSLDPLTDGGAVPSDIMVALRRWGIRAMSAPSPLGFQTDVDASNVNDEPEFAAIEAEAFTIVTGEYRIDESADDMGDQVCAALVKCGAVGIAVFVDTAFENWSPRSGALPASALNLADPHGGWHWLVITSFYTKPDSTRVFRGPNSWGVSWGDGGHFEITEGWLRKAASDVYAWHVEVNK